MQPPLGLRLGELDRRRALEVLERLRTVRIGDRRDVERRELGIGFGREEALCVGGQPVEHLRPSAWIRVVVELEPDPHASAASISSSPFPYACVNAFPPMSATIAAVSRRCCLVSAGVQSGCSAATSAATAATCGVAIDVPLQ